MVRLIGEGKRVAGSLLEARTRYMHDALVGIAREDLEARTRVVSPRRARTEAILLR